MRGNVIFYSKISQENNSPASRRWQCSGDADASAKAWDQCAIALSGQQRVVSANEPLLSSTGGSPALGEGFSWPHAEWLLVARVELVVDFQHSFRKDMGIDLRGGDIGMTQHLLDRP